MRIFMWQLLAIGLIVTAFNFTNYSTFKNMENNPVLEVVTYHVKPEFTGNRQLLVTQVNEVAQNFDGFISRKVYQSPEDSTLFMDYVKWESLEQALKAAQELPKKKELAPFMEAIKEVKSFHHFIEK